jgi:cysteinyl-tRNA synthetase
MTEITLYNTRTRAKERFAPIDPANVRMYVCGPTVYDRAHIGNARPVVVFDVLFRLLRHVYGEGQVTYVRNITDVDDKIIARAAETGQPIAEITAETTRWYHEDMAALGALPPTHEPRATQYIPQMIAMIETLVAGGHAYAAEGHVLFAVASYPDYGRFARRSLDEMQAGARVEVAPYKRDPMDFVLWKPSPPDLPGWESPWGRGRPGWHIECSAMSEALLGPSFDIHGGGIDLVFPHHENEIAQSRCAHPEAEFARVWMHNGFLNVEGEKMSKSLGNFFTVRDLLDRGIPGEVIRFVLLSTHYRQPMDWTAERAGLAEDKLRHWHREIRSFVDLAYVDLSNVSAQIIRALSNDLNTPLALTHLEREAREGEDEHDFYLQLANDLHFLGLLSIDQLNTTGATWIDPASVVEANLQIQIQILLNKRDDARKLKDFRRADAIREALAAAGIKVMDRPGQDTSWEPGPGFDPSKLAEIDT